MGPLKVTLCAGAAIFAALTPAAHAADGGGLSVTPASPAPGTDIALRTTGCATTTGTATSAAFVADARLTGSGGTLVGETRVSSSIRAGTYDVRVTCAGAQTKGALTVVEKTPPKAQPKMPSETQPKAQPHTQSETQPSAPHQPTAPASSPVAPVQAGGGGAARLGAEAEADAEADAAGPGTGHAVTGLVLAGVAAVAVALRSARRSRGTD
ncbi:hypothetical protein QQY66_17685 [Streptomyces sp. DG2A-72]|uniref:hypothetical protein n=1 Tax=Streptomyces sp. DG2A-72 TaxID=3051386 RepID=UPI00265C6ABA|nr:hypothetical protein [Streptomyces sp. DG2A-72]MDO0933427.1 hypothetical protein [Streptomyces sp. DG2A-72]